MHKHDVNCSTSTVVTQKCNLQMTFTAAQQKNVKSEIPATKMTTRLIQKLAENSRLYKKKKGRGGLSEIMQLYYTDKLQQ